MDAMVMIWIGIGLAVGLIAQRVLPGRDPGGVVVAALLGTAGALFGGFLLRALGAGGTPAREAAAALAGAVALMAIYRVTIARRRS